MQKKLVNYTDLFLGNGVSVAEYEALTRKVAALEAENTRLKNIIRRTAERERENHAELHQTRH